MNKIISLVRAARAAPNPGAVLYSDRMLAELLALNKEMIAQLRLELLSAGDGGFLTEMIEQHERAAALLRAQLEDRQAGAREAEARTWRAGSFSGGMEA
jgi:hypothetical protein